jgi:4-amino-4-deoxy-L-arabinose transferase-like glycosyltransferase
MKRRKRRSSKIDFWRRKETFIVAILLFVGFIIRFLHLSSIETTDPAFYKLPYGTDMVIYDKFAQNILKGDHPAPYYYCPLYSYFLALIYLLFGHNLYIARFVQMILGVLTLFLIYLITKRVFGKVAGFTALVIAVLYNMFVLHEGLLLIAALATFLNALSLFLLLRTEDGVSYRNVALAGIAIGLSALARANILLFVPFIFVWMLLTERRTQNAILNFGFLCLTILLTISPATMMNYISSKRFILISTNGPGNLWIGNNENADGKFANYAPPPDLAKRLAEIGDRAYIEDVIRFVKEKPADFIRLLFRKFLLFWGAFEVANNMNYEQIKSYSPVMRLPIFLGFGTVIPFALLGIFLSAKNRSALLLHLFLFSFMVATLIFFVLARYRISALPGFIPFAGFGVISLYKKIREKSYKPLSISVLILMLSSLLVHQKQIVNLCVPILHPEGIHKEEKGRLVIRDTSTEWEGGDAVVIGREEMVKKELVVKEDFSKKKITLFFKYGTDRPGKVLLNVNDKVTAEIELGFTKGLIKSKTLELDQRILNKGINSFTFRPEGELLFALCYDTSYSFGRSYRFCNGEWKRIKRGEFLVWLCLE